MLSKMKKYYLLFIALFLIVVDIRIPVLPYPDFEPFFTEAPVTVDLVINHVLGLKGRIDILSDVIGLILLLAVSVTLIRKCSKFSSCFVFSMLALTFRVLLIMMPFYLNGSARFRTAYLLYFISAILEVCTYVSGLYGVHGLMESLEYHSINNVTLIFGLISSLSLLVSLIIWFFALTVLSYIYLAVAIGFFVLWLYRVYRDRDNLPVV